MALLVLAATAGTSCRRGQVEGYKLVRLPLGASFLADIRSETRAAVGLRPGERRIITAEALPGSRLRIAFGPLREAPGGGQVRLELRVNGRSAYSGEASARPRGGRWTTALVPLDVRGPARIEIRVEHLGAAAPAGDAAWIGVATPRLYVPDRRRRRVLVWISQDAVRADQLGAYGGTRPSSPAFDRLSRDWVVFERGLAPASWTLPAMTSQLTARLPSAHGVTSLGRRRDPRHTSVFEVLAREGFTVLGVTGNGFVSKHFGLGDGFDALVHTTGNADEVNRLALRILAEWGGGDLALFLHYMDAHHPYEPPSPYERLFDAGYHGSVDGQNFRRRKDLAPEDVAHVRALYDGELAFTDSRIAALLEELRRRGLLEAAAVAYSADHGEELYDRGGWLHGDTVHAEQVHVPFALSVPGLPPRRVARPVSLAALAPTLLEALGVEPPPSFQGKSLLPVARGLADPETSVVSETERGRAGLLRIAVQEDRIKLMMTLARDAAGGAPRVLAEAVYDLASDPGERSPLADHPARERLRRHALAYLEWARAQAPAAGASEVPPELERELRALGYVE